MDEKNRKNMGTWWTLSTCTLLLSLLLCQTSFQVFYSWNFHAAWKILPFLKIVVRLNYSENEETAS